jgi:hypothetical protein
MLKQPKSPLPLSSETDNIDNYTEVIDEEIAER